LDVALRAGIDPATWGLSLRTGERDKIQMVALPMLPVRLAPGADPLLVSQRRSTPRADFLAKLSQREGEVAEALAQLPYVTNRELAEHLGKSSVHG
jgi:hypothetical protein